MSLTFFFKLSFAWTFILLSGWINLISAQHYDPSNDTSYNRHHIMRGDTLEKGLKNPFIRAIKAGEKQDTLTGDFEIVTSNLVFMPGAYQISGKEGALPEGFSVNLSAVPTTGTATLTNIATISAVDPATLAVPTWLTDVNGQQLDGKSNEKYNTGISDVSFQLIPSLTPGNYKAYIYASAPGYQTATLELTVEVPVPEVEIPEPEIEEPEIEEPDPDTEIPEPGLIFTPGSYLISGHADSIPEGFSVGLSSVPNSTTATLTAVDPTTLAPPTWLTDMNGQQLDGKNNEKYNTGISDVPFQLIPSLTPGIYKAYIYASATGYKTATLELTVEVAVPKGMFTANINFQDKDTPAPNGYYPDFGEPFGVRERADQGSGTLTYGWINPTTGQPANLIGQGRNRSYMYLGSPVLATLIHMNHPYASSSGHWEIAVPDGTYAVTVGVGDAHKGNADEYHRIHAEGVLMIENFAPFGNKGSATRFFSNTKEVNVSDGKLTLSDAGGGVNTKLTFVKILQISQQTPEGSSLTVTKVIPANAAKNVPLTQSITVDIAFPNNVSLDVTTVHNQTVKLYRRSNGNKELVTGTTVNATGGGDAITLSAKLEENTEYIFEITDQVKDMQGFSMTPFTSTFTTGADTKIITNLSDVKFKEQILVDNQFGEDGFTGLAIGPDYKLYAVTSSGTIERWDIQGDGTLDNHKTLRPFGSNKRLAINLTFDPNATASNLVAWLSHSTHGFQEMSDWESKISKLDLTNPDDVKVIDYVINLPRSSKDHVTNGIDFGPDGALYFTQGSNTGMGLPDLAWGYREEQLLSAAVLRLDVKALETTGNLPLNALTEGGNPYNPYAPGAPLTLYATGVRNAYDLVWHSNGQLYVPNNGSAAGANAPGISAGTIRFNGSAYEGPDIPPITDLRQSQEDFLFRIMEGGYYGHPNPKRREYILNGGNPTSDKDPAEVVDGSDSTKGYPIGTLPESHYRGFTYNFGQSKSPNGIIEYKSNAFGGKLKGKLMVCRFSGGDDVLIMEPGGTNLDITSVAEGDFYGDGPGKNGLRRPYFNPLTLVEDVKTGNLYISEYHTGNDHGQPQITLLKPNVPATGEPIVTFSHQEILLTDKTADGPGMSQPLTIKNTGNAILEINTVNIDGKDQDQFKILNAPDLPASIPPGNSITLKLALEASSPGIKHASLNVHSNVNLATVTLKGIGHDNDEPSLQYVLDAHQVPVSVGDDDPASSIIHSKNYHSTILGEEVEVPFFKKAGGSQVNIEVLGVFGPKGDNGTTTGFGWYMAGDKKSARELFTVDNDDHNSLMVNINGSKTFNPGEEHFGFFSRWPFFDNRYLFQEDSLNTFEEALPHHMRAFPLKDGQGFDVPNAYVVTFEEHTKGFDYQDIVLIVRNVEPFNAGPKLTFSPFAIEKNVTRGQNAASQLVKLTTSGDNTTAQIVDPQVPWLRLSGKTLSTGKDFTLNFNTADLLPDKYYATIRATADGYETARLDVTLTVTDIQPVELTGAGIAVENMTKIPKDNTGVPYDDRFVFHFILNPKPNNKAIHDQNTIRIRNTGTDELVIHQLNLSVPEEFVFVNGSDTLLPVSIQQGDFYDVALKYTGRQGDEITVDERTLEIVSNAENTPHLKVTLACGFMPFSQGENELTAQQVIDIFGFKTDMRQTLKDGSKTVRPSSDYPTAERVIRGQEGDLILSELFVAADSSKPVDAYQMAAFRGPGYATIKLADTASGTNTVGNFTFYFERDYHQSLLPKKDTTSDVLAGTSSTKVNTAFVINSSGYTTLGKNFDSKGNPKVLGVRVYKVLDRNGEVRPNEYIVIQDYVEDGCGSGSANCDWNDIMLYFRNIRPEKEPFATAMPDLTVKPGAEFSFDASAYFNIGYPGNQLRYQAYAAEDAASLPAWMSIDPATGILSGTAPSQNGYQITIALNGTDLNGLDASETLTIKVDHDGATNARLANTSPSSMDDSSEDLRSASSLQVYPNPFSNNIRITFPPNFGQQVTLSLMSVTGQIIRQMEMTIAIGGEEKVLDLSRQALEPGLYFLSIESQHQSPQVFRILKE